MRLSEIQKALWVIAATVGVLALLLFVDKTSKLNGCQIGVVTTITALFPRTKIDPEFEAAAKLFCERSLK